jgi:hypothetical protein
MRESIVLMVLVVALRLFLRMQTNVTPVTDPIVKKECGSCHTVFPAVSSETFWQNNRDTRPLRENASLGEAEQKAVLDFLLSHAADSPNAGREGRKFGTSIPQADTPLRITETPRWVKEHREVKAEKWKDPNVKSKANCLGCHKGAEQGVYED